MKPRRLDSIDRAILEVMKSRGRVRNAHLASLVGLSESACLVRVRRLEQEGFILGYAAILSEAARDGGFEAWLSISLGGATDAVAQNVAGYLSSSRHVLLADRVTGAGDWIVRFSASAAADWRTFCLALEAGGVPAGGIRTSIILIDKPSSVTSFQDIACAAGDD